MVNHIGISVPCRGILFFNTKTNFKIKKEIKRFPSPVGESYFSIGYRDMKLSDLANRFPSPVGESYFSIDNTYLHNTNHHISVPCRGILFFNATIVSESNAHTVFPSPVGESYFSINGIR